MAPLPAADQDMDKTKHIISAQHDHILSQSANTTYTEESLSGLVTGFPFQMLKIHESRRQKTVGAAVQRKARVVDAFEVSHSGGARVGNDSRIAKVDFAPAQPI